MVVRRLAVLLSVLALAGCYQQANDSFSTINSATDPLPTDAVNPALQVTPVVIVPEGGASPDPDELVQLQVTGDGVVSATSTLEPIPLPSNATPTVIIISPPLETPTPDVPPPGVLLPTGTPPMLITPQPASQLVLPASTPITGATQGALPPNNGIQTPTQLPSPTSEACTYVIRSGDTLFRIALNNNVPLAQLLALNGLTESSIIQPGQVVQLPNCADGSTNPSLPTPAVVEGNAAPATLESAGGSGAAPGGSQRMHTVASGETLYGIAQRYGVTVQAIINANNLANPDRLSIGQQLIIPVNP